MHAAKRKAATDATSAFPVRPDTAVKEAPATRTVHTRDNNSARKTALRIELGATAWATVALVSRIAIGSREGAQRVPLPPLVCGKHKTANGRGGVD
jgi:hypothetical protein